MVAKDKGKDSGYKPGKAAKEIRDKAMKEQRKMDRKVEQEHKDKGK